VKTLTRDQLESRKEKAVRFTRDVLGDPNRADETAKESLEDYAERRKIQITNPSRRRNAIMANNRTHGPNWKPVRDYGPLLNVSYPSADTPTSSASFTQCRGCGRRLPERMSLAYIFETPMADIIVDLEKGFNRG
jgi:hypothetical protein